MTSHQSSAFQSEKVQTLLARLHAESETADQPFMDRIGQLPAGEREAVFADYRQLYGLAHDAFLPIGEDLGRLLYMLARSANAHTIVEFGTSFGISTIYLAAALRDNGGGGKLITCEMEPTKSQRAQSHLTEAGLADLVEFRIGDALDLLSRDLPAQVDFLLLDGAKPLYLPVLKLIEPHLKPGALIASDNINTRNKVSEFTDYIRTPANGYLSVAMPLGDGIELSMRTL